MRKPLGAVLYLSVIFLPFILQNPATAFYEAPGGFCNIIGKFFPLKFLKIKTLKALGNS
jgi:hypothetical protein